MADTNNKPKQGTVFKKRVKKPDTESSQTALTENIAAENLTLADLGIVEPKEVNNATKNDIYATFNTTEEYEEIKKSYSVAPLDTSTLDVLDVDRVVISMFSAEEIRKQSVVQIIKPTDDTSVAQGVNDARMGPIEYDVQCPKCGEKFGVCPGHFGHIELNAHIINPLAMKELIKVLSCVCNQDGKLLVSDEVLKSSGAYKYHGVARLEYIQALVEKHGDCSDKEGCRCKRNPYFHYTKSAENNEIVYTDTKTVKPNTPYYSYGIADVETILKSITKETYKKLGFREGNTALNFIMSAFLVVPPVDRQPTIQDSAMWADPVTKGYVEIVKINNKLADPLLVGEDRRREINNLVKEINNILFNDKKAVIKRIQGKGNAARDSQAKRVDYSGRTVISPDSSLAFGQVRIPSQIARILTKPMRVNAINKKEAEALLRQGRVNTIVPGPLSKLPKPNSSRAIMTTQTYTNINSSIPSKFVIKVTDKLKKTYVPQIGDTLNRWLKDGDYIILNRQPTLSKYSWMGMEVVVGWMRTWKNGNQILTDGPKTIAFPTPYTTAFNADHDGDEMNIHVPQSEQTDAELAVLNSVEACLMNQNNQNAMGVVYNSNTGAHRLTLDGVFVDFDTQNQMLMQITDPMYRTKTQKMLSVFLGEKYIPIEAFDRDDWLKRLKKYHLSSLSGKAIFSALFPRDFKYENGSTVIMEGILVKGPVTKNQLGPVGNSIVQALFNQYNTEVAAKFMTDATFIIDEYINRYPLTIGFVDCNPKNPKIKEDVNLMIEEAKLAQQATAVNISDPIEAQRQEAELRAVLNNVGNVGAKIVSESLDKKNNLGLMIRSGTKGKTSNVAQITASIGQQYLQGERLKPGLAYFDINDPSTALEQRGFIKSSFTKGMTPEEMFMHQASGREGLIDTALKTADTGSLQHLIIKSLEDLVVWPDGSVRDNTGNIYMAIYGHDGLEPARLMKLRIKGHKNIVLSFFSADMECGRLNTKYLHEKPIFLEENHIESIISRVFNVPGEEKDDMKATVFPSCYKRLEKVVYKNTTNLVRKVLSNASLVPSGFSDLVDRLIYLYKVARVAVGEPVGIHAGEVMSQPLTQSTLNSFHQSGSARNMGSSIDRFRAMLNISDPKYPSANIHFLNKNLKMEDIVRKRSQLVSVPLSQLMLDYDILSEINEKDAWWYNLTIKLSPDVLTNVSTTSCLRLKLDVIKMLNHGITLENIRRQLERGGGEHIRVIRSPDSKGILYIYASDQGLESFIQNKTGDILNISTVFFQIAVMPTFDKIYFQGVPGISAIFPVKKPIWDLFSGEQQYYNKQQIEEYGSEDKALEDEMKRTWILNFDRFQMNMIGLSDKHIEEFVVAAGMTLVERLYFDEDSIVVTSQTLESPMTTMQRKLREETENERLYKKEHKDQIYVEYPSDILKKGYYHYCDTNGSNLSQIYMERGIDVFATISNEIKVIYSLFGMDVAQNVYISEMTKTLQEIQDFIDPRHLYVLVSFIFRLGRPVGVNFRGMLKQHNNFLGLMTVQSSVDIAAQAALLGTSQPITNTSARIVVNKELNVGTGVVAVVPDPEFDKEIEEMLKKGQTLSSSDLESAIEQDTERRYGVIDTSGTDLRNDIQQSESLFDMIYGEAGKSELPTAITIGDKPKADKEKFDDVGITNPATNANISGALEIIAENTVLKPSKKSKIVKDVIVTSEIATEDTQTKKKKKSVKINENVEIVEYDTQGTIIGGSETNVAIKPTNVEPEIIQKEKPVAGVSVGGRQKASKISVSKFLENL